MPVSSCPAPLLGSGRARDCRADSRRRGRTAGRSSCSVRSVPSAPHWKARARLRASRSCARPSDGRCRVCGSYQSHISTSRANMVKCKIHCRECRIMRTILYGNRHYVSIRSNLNYKNCNSASAIFCRRKRSSPPAAFRKWPFACFFTRTGRNMV